MGFLPRQIRSFARRGAVHGATLLFIVVLDFCLVRLGGSAFVGEAGAAAGVEADVQKEIVRRHREEFGLDRPVVVQFFSWLGAVATGDLGRSLSTREEVSARLKAALPSTLLLQGTALVLIFALGICLGVFSVEHRGGFVDRALGLLLIVFHSIPGFWLATLLILAFASQSGLGWLPLERLRDRDAASFGAFERLGDLLLHMILPVTCLVLPGLAAVARQTRTALEDALDTDYVRTARALGHSEKRIVRKWALRNALGPVVVLLGAQIPELIGGAIVVETIFGIDGMGWLLFRATVEHDYPMLQAFFLLVAVTTVIGYAVTDALYARLFPRIARG